MNENSQEICVGKKVSIEIIKSTFFILRGNWTSIIAKLLLASIKVNYSLGIHASLEKLLFSSFLLMIILSEKLDLSNSSLY